MKNRIKTIMDSGGYTPATFAAHIDVNPQTMTATMKRNDTASTPILQAILKKYKNINAEWLMLGEGAMYKNGDAEQPQQQQIPPLFPKNTDTITVTQRPQAPYQQKESPETPPEKPAETVKYQEVIVEKEKLVVKKATKVIVYYADNTFDSFVPED
jgi:DNA-binding XRE family transcriptional regulator